MSRYQAYAEYKDSGVEWLGVIPSHWQRLKFKFASNEGKAFASGPFGSSIGSQFYRDIGVPVIRGNNLSLDAKKPKYNDDGYVFLDESKADELANAEVIAGDLVFTARGTVGQIGLIPDKGILEWKRAILSANQLRFRNGNTGFNSVYLWYLFSSWVVRTQIALSSDSVAQPNLNLGSLKDLNLFKPLWKEQETIANFLDHETAKIDLLIEKQQGLIALLKEKRLAVISHAVTKGLNPNAPMKDSGVEWLGEVPEHWVCSGLKYYARIVDCKHITAEFYDEGIPLASIGEVKEWAVNLQNAKCTSEKYYLDLIGGGRKPEVGDIIYSRNATVGEAALVVKDMPLFAMGQDVCLIKLNNEISPEYILHVLKSLVVTQQLDLAMVGSTFKRINVDDIRNFFMVFPSYTEQLQIVSELNRVVERYDSLTNKAESTISLMQERRTALISAAVTGKIDVRGFVRPEQQAA